MSALLIKNMPAPLHDRLRQRAAAHHRSMNREVIAILEVELATPVTTPLPAPVKPLKPINSEWTVQIVRDARDGRR
jgi:plasmid stability protein